MIRVVVHVGKDETVCGHLHFAGFIVPFLKIRAGPRGQIGVARAVDVDFSHIGAERPALLAVTSTFTEPFSASVRPMKVLNSSRIMEGKQKNAGTSFQKGKIPAYPYG